LIPAPPSELERDPSAAAKRFKGELRASWRTFGPDLATVATVAHLVAPAALAEATQSEIFNQRMTIRRQHAQEMRFLMMIFEVHPTSAFMMASKQLDIKEGNRSSISN